MILIPILLAFFTGLLILRLCNQHKYINIFEQLALGFCIGLSLFVFELFLQGIILNHLSLLFPVITFVVCLGLLIYKNSYRGGFTKVFIYNVKADFYNIKSKFNLLKKWKKYTIGIVAIYLVFKLFMVFSININMPTYADDALVGRDLQTKILFENKSLVLDKTNPAYMGTSFNQGRSLFSAVADYYLLSTNKVAITNAINYTNIFSSLVYFVMLLLIFGSLLKYTDIFFASLGGYALVSIPFLFTHGFASYTNLIHGFYFMFVFVFLYKAIRENNKGFLTISSFLMIPLIRVRKEGFLIFLFFVAFYLIYDLFINKNKLNFKNIITILGPGIFGYVLFTIFYRVFQTTQPTLTAGDQLINGGMNIFSISLNMGNLNVDNFFLSIKQLFERTEFMLAPLVFLILTIFVLLKKKTINLYFSILLWFIILVFIMFFMMRAGHEGIVGFVGVARYGLVIVPSMVFLSSIMTYDAFVELDHKTGT